jgi:hypothetical protein
MGMRIVKIELNGQEYELTFSARVMMLQEQEKWDTDTFTGTIHMLSAMMEAGDKLARHEGRPAPGFLSVDDIADFLSPEDITRIVQAMTQAQTGERHVEALPDSKNAANAPSAP